MKNICFEINRYEVEREDFVSGIGRYRKYDVKNFDTLEEAIVYARQSSKDGFRVAVRQISNVVGWWKGDDLQ